MLIRLHNKTRAIPIIYGAVVRNLNNLFRTSFRESPIKIFSKLPNGRWNIFKTTNARVFFSSAETANTKNSEPSRLWRTNGIQAIPYSV